LQFQQGFDRERDARPLTIEGGGDAALSCDSRTGTDSIHVASSP
jgi:hypothetical protein